MKRLFRFLAPVVAYLSLCFLLFAQVETPAPSYFAKAFVQLKGSHGDAEEILRKHLPIKDSSVRLTRVRDTGFFEIGVTASDPDAAAKRANDIAIAMQEALGKGEEGERLLILEKAERPTRPFVPQQTNG